MSEVAFPVLGAAFVLSIVLPLSAFVTKLALLWLERDEAGGLLNGLSLRYVLLSASSVVPLAWFMSAGIHQAETGRSVLACLLEHHESSNWCAEPAFFALLLAAGAGAAWLHAARGTGAVKSSNSPAANALRARIAGLIGAQPLLSNLSGRVVVTEKPGISLATFGLWSPRVFIGSSFAEKLTDSMLVSALAHEYEHVRSRDPLRYLLLKLALSLNPFGRFLLAPHVARWKGAREAHCDREAVLHGAAPLSLADAIVRAARPVSEAVAPLGATDTGVLKLRIGMLLAFAERAPTRCRHENPASIPVALALLVMALLLPHRTGTSALDAVHTGAERALTYVLN